MFSTPTLLLSLLTLSTSLLPSVLSTTTITPLSLSFTTNKLLSPIPVTCSSTHATPAQKSSCSSKGSLFCAFPAGGQTLCSSEETRTEVGEGLVCPLEGWWMHKEAKCCVPETTVSTCDCGEGYSYSTNKNKCQTNNGGSCKWNEWWHSRSSSCCPNSPPKPGKCPGNNYCPSDWYWCDKTNKCRPNHPRSPQPDCGSHWNHQTQCCNPGTTPSGKPAPPTNPSPPSGPSPPTPGGPDGPSKPHDGHKRRAINKRKQKVVDSAVLDAMYCPAPMKACTILSPPTASPEWAYECIDTATELESCGGCTSQGQGQDCTMINGADSVGCQAGSCVVLSCLRGWTAVNGTSCVRN